MNQNVYSNGPLNDDSVYNKKQDFKKGDLELAVVEFSSSRKRASVAVKHTVEG